MRTNIDIDDALIAEAMQLTQLPTKKATVEEALQRLIRSFRQQEALKDLWGIGWEGDLNTMREER
jgi:Arc/MetJ family transcription regulator